MECLLQCAPFVQEAGAPSRVGEQDCGETLLGKSRGMSGGQGSDPV